MRAEQRRRCREHELERYNLVRFEKGADGAKVLTVLLDYYPLTLGNLGLYGEKWRYVAKK